MRRRTPPSCPFLRRRTPPSCPSLRRRTPPSCPSLRRRTPPSCPSLRRRTPPSCPCHSDITAPSLITIGCICVYVLILLAIRVLSSGQRTVRASMDVLWGLAGSRGLACKHARPSAGPPDPPRARLWSGLPLCSFHQICRPGRLLAGPLPRKSHSGFIPFGFQRS